MRAVVIHAAKDVRVEERDAGPIGPGQVAVRIEAGGICGSDLHYFNHGGFGTVRLREPMILGHEIAGTITAVAPDVRKRERRRPRRGQPEPTLPGLPLLPARACPTSASPCASMGAPCRCRTSRAGSARSWSAMPCNASGPASPRPNWPWRNPSPWPCTRCPARARCSGGAFSSRAAGRSGPWSWRRRGTRVPARSS